MKELKEEAYQKKNNDLKQKLKKKEMVLITSLETKQKDKMEEKRRIITEMIEKENRAKKKHSNLYERTRTNSTSIRG